MKKLGLLLGITLLSTSAFAQNRGADDSILDKPNAKAKVAGHLVAAVSETALGLTLYESANSVELNRLKIAEKKFSKVYKQLEKAERGILSGDPKVRAHFEKGITVLRGRATDLAAELDRARFNAIANGQKWRVAKRAGGGLILVAASTHLVYILHSLDAKPKVAEVGSATWREGQKLFAQDESKAPASAESSSGHDS